MSEVGEHLAFDHIEILADAVERIRSKIEYTTLAASLLPEPFTVKDLHGVYEQVWGVSPHLPNFRRKVLAVPGFLEDTGRHADADPSGGPRPRLYRLGHQREITPPLTRSSVRHRD